MNILIVTAVLPWPLISGGHVSQFSTLQALAKDHNFRIVLSSYSEFSHQDADELECQISSVKVIRPTDAEPVGKIREFLSLLSTGKSMLKSAFRGFFSFVLKGNRSGAQDVLCSAPLVRPYYPFSPLPLEVISLILANSEWADVIQAEFHESLFVGFLPISRIPKIFICHQVHNVFAKTFYESSGTFASGSSPIKELVAESDRLAALHIECAAMNLFDRIVLFSDSDRNSIDGQCSAPLRISPFPLPSDIRWMSPDVSFVAPTRLLFLGPGYWHPNVDALNWFYVNVLTQLCQAIMPSAPLLHVAGHWDAKQIASYDPELVYFHGFVSDLSSCLQGSVSLNPVFTGAGLRTKLLAAAASGSPIVSTTHGAAGTGFVHGEHCLLADNENDFAYCVSSLLKDDSLARQLATNAFKHVQDCFSYDAVCERRNHIYNEVVKSN